MITPLFAREGDDADGVYIPAVHTRGPWDPGLLHGGPVAALFAETVQARMRPEAQPARLTVDLLRPVPLERLRLRIERIREGRRLEVHAAELATVDGDRLVARATVTAITPVAIDGADDVDGSAAFDAALVPPVDRPDDDDRPWGPPSSAESFVGGAMDFRFGAQIAPQHGRAWLRLWRPVLDEVPISPLARAAAAADVGNAVSASREGAMPRISFVNADLSLSVARLPEGEWIRLESRGRWRPDGLGWVSSSLADTRGEVGAVSNALVLDVMPAGFDWQAPAERSG